MVVGIISLVVVGILTRNLGPVGFGYYNSIFAFLIIFSTIADLGLYPVMTREIAKTGGREEESVASKIFTLRLVLVVVAVLAASVVGLLFAPYPKFVKLGILVASLFSVFSSLSQVLTGIFQKYLRLYLVSLSDVIARGVQLTMLATSLIFRPGLLFFIWAVVVAEIVHFFVILKFSRSIVRIKLDIDWSYWKAIAKNALPVALSLVFVFLYFKMDTVMLSFMKPASDVGIYSVAYKILEVVIFLPAVYMGLVMPLLSKCAQAKKEQFLAVFKNSYRVVSIFALPASVYIFLFAPPIVRIIGGSDFGSSAVVLRILSLAIFAIFFGNLGGYSIIALDIQKKGVWVYLLGAVLNIGLNLLFIPSFSYIAAAWTTVVTEVVVTFLLFRLIRKEGYLSPDNKAVAKTIPAVALATVATLPFLNNFILASAVFLIYFPLLFFMKGFRWQEVSQLLSPKS